MHWLIESALAHDDPPRHLHVGGLGVDLTLNEFNQNFFGFLAVTIVSLCVILFLIGAFLTVLSRGKQDTVQKGKDLMLWSLVGLAVVLGSYGIVRTAFFFLYS